MFTSFHQAMVKWSVYLNGKVVTSDHEVKIQQSKTKKINNQIRVRRITYLSSDHSKTVHASGQPVTRVKVDLKARPRFSWLQRKYIYKTLGV